MFWRATDDRHKTTNSTLSHAYQFSTGGRNAYLSAAPGAGDAFLVGRPSDEEVALRLSPEERNWWGRFRTKLYVPVRMPSDQPDARIIGIVVASYERDFDPASNPTVWCTTQTMTALSSRVSELIARSGADVAELVAAAAESNARVARASDGFNSIDDALVAMKTAAGSVVAE